MNICTNLNCVFRDYKGRCVYGNSCYTSSTSNYKVPKTTKSEKNTSDMTKTTERFESLKEALERQKSREPGTYDIYNYDILRYLRNKFPEESESSIQEAAAFISYRTVVVVQDLNAELSREWQKAFNREIQKYRKKKEEK